MQRLLDRVRDLLLNPKQCWTEIRDEEATVVGLFREYLVYLAALPPVVFLIANLGVPAWEWLVTAVVYYLLLLVSVYIYGKVVFFLADNFGAQRDDVAAMKVAAYSATPWFLARIFSTVPALWMVGLVGAIYSIYLLYQSLDIVLETPGEKVKTYTAFVVVISIIVHILLTMVLAGGFGLSLYIA